MKMPRVTRTPTTPMAFRSTSDSVSASPCPHPDTIGKAEQKQKEVNNEQRESTHLDLGFASPTILSIQKKSQDPKNIQPSTVRLQNGNSQSSNHMSGKGSFFYRVGKLSIRRSVRVNEKNQLLS